MLIHLTGMKQKTLLCWLALNPRAAVSTDTLIAALWDDIPPPSARTKVHTYISEIRRALQGVGHIHAPGWPVFTHHSGYQLYDDVELDNWWFEANASEARHAGRLGEHAQASALFARALQMWRGPALPGIPSYTIQAAASTLNEKRLLAIEGKAEADIQLGWHDEVIADLSPVSAANPLRERLRGVLMLALYRHGARNEALELYRKGHQVISSELGLPPSPQLRRLQQLMLRDDHSLWTQSANDLLSMKAVTDEA